MKAGPWTRQTCISGNQEHDTLRYIRYKHFHKIFITLCLFQRDYKNGLDPWYPRERWDSYDPMLLSEGAFAAGMILSFLKLVHIFSINPYLGPLQVSLGRMILDIIKFFFVYMLVLFAFGCGELDISYLCGFLIWSKIKAVVA